MTVSTFLAIHGYRAALNKALELIIGISCGYIHDLGSLLRPTPLAIALGYPESTFSRFSPCEPSWDWLTLCKLLEHGADPAHLFGLPRSTAYRDRWPRVFVMNSTGALANLLLQFEHWKRVHEFGCHSAEFGWFQQFAGNRFQFRTQKLRGFSEDSLVDVVRLLIEHGADLHELVPVYEVVECAENGRVIFDYANVNLTTREIIERRIPIAQSPDWQALLDEHSTVEKRAQLKAARKLMIERWPVSWLSTADRRLLRFNLADNYDIVRTLYADRLSFEDLRRMGILWKVIDLSEECHAPPGSSHFVSPGIFVEDSAAVGDSEDDSSNSKALPPARRFSFDDASEVVHNIVQNSPLGTSCNSGRDSPLSTSCDSRSRWRPITRRRTLS